MGRRGVLPGVAGVIAALGFAALVATGSRALGPVVVIATCWPVAELVRRHRLDAGRTWRLFAAGIVIHLAAVVVSVGAPSDVIAWHGSIELLAGLFFVLAVGSTVTIRAVGARSALLDAVTLSAAVALMVWVGLLSDRIDATALDGVERSLALAAPAAALIVFVAVLTLHFLDAYRRQVKWALGAATLFFALGQLSDAWAMLGGSSRTVTHVFNLAMAGAFAYTVRLTDERWLPPTDQRRRTLRRGHVVLYGTAVATIPAAFALTGFSPDSADALAMAVATGVGGLALVLRFVSAVIDAELDARRDQLLVVAGQRMLAGEDTTAVIAETALELGAGYDPQSFVIEDGRSRAAATGLAVPELAEDDRWPGLIPVADACTQSVIDDGERDVHFVSLAMGHRPDRRCHLVVLFSRRPSVDVVDALRSLSVGAALSAERDALALLLAERRSEDRFEAFVENIDDIVGVVDEDGMLRYISPAIRRVFGVSPDVLLDQPYFRLFDRENRSESVAAFETIQAAAEGTTVVLETEVPTPAGPRTVELIVCRRFEDPLIHGCIVTGRDVTERRQMEDQLRHQATHDPLTGLVNRLVLEDQLGTLLGTEEPGSVGVLFFDLDDFKQINDSLGHRTGDDVLKALATRMRTWLGWSSTVSRMGGDEFAAILTGLVSEEDAARSARMVADALAVPVEVDGRPVQVRASIGVATDATCAPRSPEVLLRNADVAMYRAKHNGSGIVMFAPHMHEAQLRQLEVAATLPLAIEEGHVDIALQPIVSLDDGAIHGFEALARWHHPELGEIGPEEFVGTARQLGLIHRLGEHVLRRALREASRWDGHDLTVSVNVEAIQLCDAAFAGAVNDALEATGVRPDRLLLEITENSLVDSPNVRPRLSALRDLGVRIAIDDFGTGYSSLAYLADLPVDVVKIDKGFTARLGESSKSIALVRVAIELCRSLGLTPIVEGIESAGQAALVAATGCRLGQGYLWSRPLEPDAAAELAQRSDLEAVGTPTASFLGQ